MCAHTVAVAENFNSLRQFIDVLQKSKPECNVTKLVTTPCEWRKAGTKSGAPRKRGSDLRKVPVTTFKNRLGDGCSSDQDTDTEIRATTTAVGSTSSYGQRSSIASNESSIGGDISVGCTSQTFFSNCPPQYRSDYRPFPSSPCQSSFVPLALTDTMKCKGCMATTIAHMDHNFSYHHRYRHLHFLNRIHFL
jgi:hypothetical protein